MPHSSFRYYEVPVHISEDGAANQILSAAEIEKIDDLIHPLNEFRGEMYLQLLHHFFTWTGFFVLDG